MKRIIIVSLIVFLAQSLYSQVYKAADADAIASGADIVRVKDYTKVPSFIHFNKSTNLSVEKALTYTKQYISSEGLDFQLKNVQKNRGTEQTYRYVQTYNSIPIEFSAWLVQVKDNRVFALNGEALDNIQVNASFAITEEQALSLALDYCDAEKYMWEYSGEEEFLKTFKDDPNATYYPKAVKLIVPLSKKLDNAEFRTAYRFDIFSKMPYQRKNVYVDAISGEIIYEMSLLYQSDEVGTAQTQYSGEQQINTEYTGTEYILNDHTRGNGIRTLNCNMGIDYDAATEFTDADNLWNNVNPELDEYATDAQFATMATYDYYMNIHSRNSIDGAGYRLWSFIHFDLVENGGSSNVNAFWNGNWMTYGDGNGTSITPLTTVDICGHEVTHGLTSYTCGLNYQDESGALNEAFSDIFGTAIEFYSVPAYADWTVGEDIGSAFRSLQDPNATNKPDTYHGNYWVFGSEDYGGVHTNMSPLCYWFYLLSDGGSGTNDNGDAYAVSAIGIEKAEQIAFRLQTVYLTNTSNYHDAWFYALQAAADLYGACSDEVEAVGNGFYAIGVADAPYVDGVHVGFTTLYTESCAPPFEVQFINQSYNGDNFLWNFGDGTATSSAINPIHTYTDFGSFSVSLEVDGTACGSDFLLENDYIFIDASIPCLTLMPTSGNTVMENCSGLIYDAGGPDGNYFDNTDASITVYAPGASSIVLNILEFDIEAGVGADCNYDYIAFYNGSNTAADLINSTKYCNTNGNPGTISSTGEYITIRFVSDGGLSMAGFKIQYDCVISSTPPITYFSADIESTCDGFVNFSDNSLNYPTSWDWDFGDGTTSDLQNPTHQYLESGTFTVSLVATNEFGSAELEKENYIYVNMPIPPAVDNIQACSNTNFDINLNLDGDAYWYENIGDQATIHIGEYWDHPQLSESTTYYLREVFPGEEFNLGATNNTAGGGYFGNASYIHYLKFDAYIPFVLESVLVNADGAGVRTIGVRTSTSEILMQKAVYCDDGVSRVDVNFSIPAGENLQLVGFGVPNLFRTNEAAYLDYPFTIADVVSITESSASTGPTDYYYYFYDWEISTVSCKSPYVSIELIPEECTNSINQTILNNISIAPNPTNDIFNIYGLDGHLDYSIIITDLTGKTIDAILIDNANCISIQGLASGAYFIKVLTNEGNKVMKLIKN